MTKTAILDGDGWVYRCGGAAEHNYYLVFYDTGKNLPADFDNYRDAMKHKKEHGGVLWTRKEIEPLENCLQMVKSSLENTLDALGTKHYKLYLGGRSNFRLDLYPSYKANRESTPKPKYYRDIRDYLVGNWGGVVCDGIEADDAVGIAATDLGLGKAIIVSTDKDLNQIPGDHYDWTEGKTYSVSAREGVTFFYEQMLSGDTTDNIPGIDGIGPVKAKRALVDCKSPQDMAKAVWSAYYENRAQFGFSDDHEQFDFLERNASLLWIQRKKDDKHPFWKHMGNELGKK
jgi:5'-3' exonuclease